MPELPEVETVRRGLSPAMEGAKLARLQLNRADLRFPFPENLVAAVEGRQIIALGRRAKYLLIDLEDDLTIIAHLGMSGSFRVEEEALGTFHHPRSKDEKHDHVVFHLERGNETLKVIYNDPRRFGFLHLAKRSELDLYPAFAQLGPEPTGNALDAEYLGKRFSGKAQPLKSTLLDQTVIAGLGNIYVCEALYLARISPKRAAGRISLARLERLVEAIRAVLLSAIEAGGSSLRDYARPDGELGYFSKQFAVYGREGQPCACGGTVQRYAEGGRSTFWCPTCQRG